MGRTRHHPTGRWRRPAANADDAREEAIARVRGVRWTVIGPHRPPHRLPPIGGVHRPERTRRTGASAGVSQRPCVRMRTITDGCGPGVPERDGGAVYRRAVGLLAHRCTFARSSVLGRLANRQHCAQYHPAHEVASDHERRHCLSPTVTQVHRRAVVTRPCRSAGGQPAASINETAARSVLFAVEPRVRPSASRAPQLPRVGRCADKAHAGQRAT
jgi:hypothetical protein